MSHAEKHNHGAPSKRSITETAPKATLIMLLSGLFLLLLLTASSVNSPAPADLSAIVGPLALFISVTIGGIFCGMRLQGADKYACAALSAAIMTAILLAAKLLISAPEDRFSPAVGMIFHLLTVLFSILGALVAGRFQGTARRKKSKHRSKK